ncbi:MAG: RNA methyltransferase [Chitinophagaceae bacterium]
MLVKSQVKYIQSLSQKRQRDEDGVFVAEGPKIINELLDASNIQVQQLFAVEAWSKQYPAVPVTVVDEKELERLSFLQTPNQVVGIFKKPVLSGKISPLSLALDTIQDPGNMGTIIRCADWFGIQTIIAGKDCADVFSPKVVQSTMGSISRVQVIYEDLPTWFQKNPSVKVYAAALNGTPLAQLEPVSEGVIVIGNESKGISEAVLSKATHRITIPRKGEAESLNAAVATGIILSHLVK